MYRDNDVGVTGRYHDHLSDPAAIQRQIRLLEERVVSVAQPARAGVAASTGWGPSGVTGAGAAGRGGEGAHSATAGGGALDLPDSTHSL